MTKTSEKASMKLKDVRIPSARVQRQFNRQEIPYALLPAHSKG